MKNKSKNIVLSFVRTLPVVICIGCILLFLINKDNITVNNILNIIPQNPIPAVIILMLLYAVKSLSIVFPIIVLQIAGGFLFPPFVAVMVNILGSFIELSLPYLVGRISGQKYAEKLCLKDPKLAEIITHQTGNGFSQSFFLHIVSCLPGDAVNMYLGAVKIPYAKYISGSLLGCFPGILTATIMGTSITDPSSPAFWISASVTVILSVGSVLFYYLWQKKKLLQKKDVI